MLRGTIAEHVPGERVVFRTLTGELREYPAAQVAYVGPAQSPPDAPSGATRNTVPVRLTSDPVGLRLNLHAGTTVVPGGDVTTLINSWTPVCAAPCEGVVPRGHHRVAVSDLDGDYFPVPGGVDFTRPRSLRMGVDYRVGPRVAGWIMMIGGYGVALGSLAFLPDADDDDPNYTPMITMLSIGLVAGMIGQFMAILIKPRGVLLLERS